MAAALPLRSVVSLPLTAVLSALAAYGAISTPGLVDRWGVSAGGIGALIAWLALAGVALPLSRSRPSRRAVILLAVTAIALRAAFAMLAVGRLPHGDAQAYLTLAANLRAGHGLVIAEPFLGHDVRAFFPPLYPLLLAAWSSGFGASTPSLVTLNTIIDLAAAAMLVALATRIGRPAAGRAAAWLYLIWPSTLFSAALAQKEGLSVLLILTIATAWIGNPRPTLPRSATIGVATGLLALTQPGEAPLAALLGIVLIGRLGWASVLRVGIPAAIVAKLVLLPWWVRNWLVFGAFVPLTTSGGVSLWVGNNPDATGNWMPPPAWLRGLPELDYGRQAAAIARAWIVAHPLDWMRLTLTKFVRAAGVGQFGLSRLEHMRPALPAGAMLLPLSQGAHLAMLVGAAGAARIRADRGASTLLLLIAACGLQMALFGIWFEFGERHREFVTPFLLLLICVGIQTLQAGSVSQTPRPRRNDPASS